MHKTEAEILMEKYLAGTADAEERGIIESWYLETSDEGASPDPGALERKEEEVWAGLAINQPHSRKIKLWRRFAATAAVLLVFSGLYFYESRYNRHVNPNLVQDLNANDIAPGKNAATLTLASGKKIRLSEAIKGRLAQEGGVSITKTKNGQLIYELLTPSSQGRKTKPADEFATAYNTLTTARGETYQVILPDQTRVWLNAASSIKYPASFASLKERKVELTGEAYFVVKHNAKQPFRVQTQKQLVEDIGTEFNINAYTDEPGTKTTLVEGSAKVTGRIGTPSFVTLRPDQQSVLEGEALTVSPANIEEATAWRSGAFVFASEPIPSIMRKIARWYNVDIEYRENIIDRKFTGTISRYSNVAEVLQTLSLTNKINFKIEGRKIIVTN